MEEFTTNWLNKLEEEELIIRELLDYESPLSVLTSIVQHESNHSTDTASNHLDISNVCIGPPIQDTEDELWKAQRDDASYERSALPTGISILEKGLNKMDHKYTLKIKSCGNALADDGYKWRKYGQKSIKNSHYPRSYFRCTNPKCCAKKQVERCSGDPDTLIITYEGLHLHYTFDHFLSAQPNQAYPPTKKFKKTTAETRDTSSEAQAQDCSPLTDTTLPNPTMFVPHQVLFEGVGQQGLLEDLVPLNILKPSIVNTLSNSSSTSSSNPSSPPTSSSSSLTWPPKFPSIDVGATSSMI